MRALLILTTVLGLGLPAAAQTMPFVCVCDAPFESSPWAQCVHFQIGRGWEQTDCDVVNAGQRCRVAGTIYLQTYDWSTLLFTFTDARWGMPLHTDITPGQSTSYQYTHPNDYTAQVDCLSANYGVWSLLEVNGVHTTFGTPLGIKGLTVWLCQAE